MSSFTLESLIVAGFLKAEWTICEQVPLKPGNQRCFADAKSTIRRLLGPSNAKTRQLLHQPRLTRVPGGERCAFEQHFRKKRGLQAKAGTLESASRHA